MKTILFIIVAPFILGLLLAFIQTISSLSRALKDTPSTYVLTSETVQDALCEIDAMTGHEFEHYVASLLKDIGYTKVFVTPGSGDQGVDIVATRNGVKYAFQCKNYSRPLGNKPIQEVVTGRIIWNCDEAVVVTNNYFTKGAIAAAQATNVILWDRDCLIELLEETL